MNARTMLHKMIIQPIALTNIIHLFKTNNYVTVMHSAFMPSQHGDLKVSIIKVSKLEISLQFFVILLLNKTEEKKELLHFSHSPLNFNSHKFKTDWNQTYMAQKVARCMVVL